MHVRFLLLALLLYGSAAPATASSPAIAPRELRVLFVGNSLIYVNNLPATLRALAAAQPAPTRIATVTYAAPGGTVAERWNDGHAADALRSGKWDAVVLQERGGLLACMIDAEQRSQRECRASERAHRQFAELAKTRGARVLLLATWGPDEAWQHKLDRAIKQLASRTSAGIIPAGSTLRGYAAQHPQKTNFPPTRTSAGIIPAGSTLRGYAAQHRQTPTFPDQVHPSLPATLIMAAQLYRAITGSDAAPRDVILDFPLLPPDALVKPDAPLEVQPQLAGDGKRVVLTAAAIAPLLQAAKP